MDRRSSFLGHETEVRRTKTTCLGCSVGCGIECLTRDNLVLRIDSDWEAHNGGLLCAVGRFEAIAAPPPRVATPLVRRDGRLAAARGARPWRSWPSGSARRHRRGPGLAADDQ